MKYDGPLALGPIRAHAIILTRNRAVELGRCVETAISTMMTGDALTVIDDSCVASMLGNYELLASAASRSRTYVAYINARQVQDIYTREAKGRSALWQSRSAPRDIAPLRNLALLLSASVDAQTTILIDDDISCFDIDRTHSLLDALNPGAEGLVVGAEIGGITEQDTVTRLTDAMRLIETSDHGKSVTVNELFQVRSAGEVGECRWVSGGYMAFRLPPNRLFAFPPGYNEDWLWCLLLNAGGTPIIRLAQAVIHQPSLLRQPTHDEIFFELVGDLIFEYVAAFSGRQLREADMLLGSIGKCEFNPDLLPVARVRRVLEQAHSLSENGHQRLLLHLARFGLTALRELLRSGQLDVDCSEILGDWIRDARAKNRDFTLTLKNEATLATFKSIWCDGRL